jgi:hypothetical protein
MFRAHRIVPVVLAVAVLGLAPACAAQYGRYGQYPRGGGARVDDRAFRNGYQEGRAQGENDMRRGRDFDYNRHREYRDADNGYGGYGNRNEYRQEFRRGFVNGYNDGYRRFGGGYPGDNRYPGNNRYPDRSAAAENGYRDGYEEGRRDGRAGNRPDPIRESRYREGDHDYNSRYGSRDDYKREYRAAFQQGYEQAYRENRRY